MSESPPTDSAPSEDLGIPTPGKRGSGYTSNEDLFVCQAFISASEDPIIGTSQKGKQFKAKMYACYCQYIKVQVGYDNSVNAAFPSTNVLQEGVGAGSYPFRSAASIFETT
jgi:hypothetical protein